MVAVLKTISAADMAKQLVRSGATEADAIASLLSAAAGDPIVESELLRRGAKSVFAEACSRSRQSVRAAAITEERMARHLNSARTWSAKMAAENRKRQYDEEKARVMALAWMDHYPIAGRPMGDCTRIDLIVGAEQRKKNAKGNANAAKFLQEVANRVPDGSVVRDVLTEDEIARIAKRTGHTRDF